MKMYLTNLILRIKSKLLNQISQQFFYIELISKTIVIFNSLLGLFSTRFER
mgnify:CR=1 FL=1